MTAGPRDGPASVYPTLNTPALICFSAPNEVFVSAFVIDSFAVLILGAVLVIYRCVPATTRAAFRMCSLTTSGLEIMITCEPSTSTISAPARRACARTTSAPAVLSPVATTAQDGNFLQAGGPDASLNAAAATGRWVTAISAVVSAGRSAAKASRIRAGLIANSTDVSPSCPVG